MRDLFRLIGWTVVDLFRSRAAIEAEIWTLRQQINVLRGTAPKRLSFSVVDHLVFAGLYRLFPKICDALTTKQERDDVRLASCKGAHSPGQPIDLYGIKISGARQCNVSFRILASLTPARVNWVSTTGHS
jgi:hypothetical protein